VAGAGRVVVPYVRDLGYTHLELLPISSIRSTARGDISPSGLRADSRFGTPDDFRAFVDAGAQAGSA
jgi:1,4-alpha-glucan branching enzyme